MIGFVKLAMGVSITVGTFMIKNMAMARFVPANLGKAQMVLIKLVGFVAAGKIAEVLWTQNDKDIDQGVEAVNKIMNRIKEKKLVLKKGKA